MVKEAIEGKVLVSESEPKEKDEANNTATKTSAPESEKMDEDAPTIFSGSEEMKEGNKEEVKKDTDGENKTEVKKEMNEGNKKEEVNKGKDEDNKEEEAKRQEKEEKKSNKKAGKSRKRNRKKAKPMNADVEAAKDVDKAETSDKKKSSKNVESMGMIFMCNSKTKRDCYQYKVLGLPASKKELVSKVYKGTRLFLFDVDLKLMYGIYKAAGPGGYNIEPKAFKSAFPSQVRFTVLEDCLPLAEEKFKAVIKDNYYGKNKFNCQLTAEQVKNLCKLFLVTTKGSKSKRAGRSSRIETHTFRERDGSRWQGHDGLRHPVLDREVFYPDSVDMHERKGRPLEIRQPPLPPPVRQRHPLYAHERPSDVEYYRRDVRIEHHDPRLLDSELRPSDAEYYRRDSHIEHHDPWLLDSELRPSDAEYYRRDSHIEHHDPRLLDLELRRREEISYRDPYRIYREPPIYPAAPLPPLYRY